MIELTSANFEQEVLKYPGTVLVDFYTPECPPCKAMAPLLQEVSTERASTLKVAKINAGEDLKLAAQFRILNVPTFILFHDGVPQKQFTGFRSKKALLGWIDAKN